MVLAVVALGKETQLGSALGKILGLLAQAVAVEAVSLLLESALLAAKAGSVSQ